LHRNSINIKQIVLKKPHYGVLIRHPQLSWREPRAATVFIKESINEFFSLPERIAEDNNLDATRICNADETRIATVQEKPRKVISRKGISQVCSISSGE
jgi:hypothetical protein